MYFDHMEKVLKIAFIEIFSKQKTINIPPPDPQLRFMHLTVDRPST